MEPRKYKHPIFQQMYDNFNKMFQEEGDCYDSILTSLEADYEHNMMEPGPPKHVVKSVLQDVAVDYYRDKIDVLTEKEYLNGRTQI